MASVYESGIDGIFGMNFSGFSRLTPGFEAYPGVVGLELGQKKLLDRRGL